MKKIFIAAILASGITCYAQETTDSAASKPQGFVFTEQIIIPSTSVKDQNKSGTCWSFAGTGFIEDNVRKVKGDSLDLSEMFTVYMCYLDKARRNMRLQGKGNISQGGSIVDVPYVMANYGAIPEEVYNGLNYGSDKHDHGELSRALTAYLQAVTTGGKVSTAWEAGLIGILDAYFGKIPETFEYKGKTYTPESYASSLGLDFNNDFIALTSYTHHPYYQSFALEVCDNWLWAPYYNVPLDKMMDIIDNALENGYTVNWAADVSEKGFKWKDGYAVLPAKKSEADLTDTELSRWVTLSDADREAEAFKFTGPEDLVEVTVTPEERQRMFDTLETTDDHGMVICGTAIDQLGNKFYKVKNSWDTNQVYNGYFYASRPYVMAKTMSFMVHKDALPKDIKKQLNLK